jgi:hypothetical protein
LDDGYQKILSYSTYTGKEPSHKSPLPNYIHTCYTIEKECIKAGYSPNNNNVPFLAFCGQCITYKSAIDSYNHWIVKKNSQWECGRQYRCCRLKTWRTGINIAEGLYNASITSPIDLSTETPKQAPQSVNFTLPSVNSVLPSQLTNAFISTLSQGNESDVLGESVNNSYINFTTMARQQSRQLLDSSFDDFGL